MARVGIELAEVVARLDRLFPATLAANWDNVGLLMRPSGEHQVRVALLTNDLTRPVLDEAVSMGADLLLSYHPPLFRPTRRLCADADWKSHVLVTCMEKRMAVYSPHTAADSVSGGVNDWLSAALSPLQTAVPLQTPSEKSTALSVNVTVNVMNCQDVSQTAWFQDMRALCYRDSSVNLDIRAEDRQTNICASFPEGSHSTVKHLRRLLDTAHVDYQLSFESHQQASSGTGRLVCLQKPMSLQDAVARFKAYLQLKQVRLARAVDVAVDRPIRTMAVCAGSGGSLLLPPPLLADLLVSGEMSHHELLDATHSGCHVLLLEHSNSERGYLSLLADTLQREFEQKVDVRVSAVDRDPIDIV